MNTQANEMTVSEIRQVFFDFFERKQHKIVDSAPMVIKNDPTLMFTNAGMNQFKDYFLGHQKASNTKVANAQKCLRVSGKHNDLEEVGVDTYHHTMFEMLGNWSFGDYFKENAIQWAWELLTEIYKIDKDKLYVTVFEGDIEDGLEEDKESIKIWQTLLDKDRILLASKKDNFWEMGETGPCGPCSEIHIDLRSNAERNQIDGKTLVNRDHPQVVEIWNLVFMQFNRKSNGSLEKLPEMHVDTGMGLERLAMALQGKKSNYDIDLFQSLIQKMQSLSNKPYGKQESDDIAHRVIADHIRTICFSIADGQLPSNNGAGYVIRRILRRAVRYGYQTLDLKEPFLCELSKTLTEVMGDPYSELVQQKELIYKVIKEEEISFFRTLELGIKRIEELIDSLKKNKINNEISGQAVFELYDTYGFPVDLTSLIAREHGLSIDEEGFQKELAIQKDRSRAATSVETDDWQQIHPEESTEFIGYDTQSCEVKIIKYRKVTQKQKSFYQLVLNKTPFYPEGGGQVGDKGFLKNASSSISIFDTKKENNLIIHLTEKLPTALRETFTAQVDSKNQELTSFNHSATHLLHHSLRSVLGSHVEQKGSLVNASYLRFDFSHFSKVSPEELEQIEKMVIESIHKSIPLDERRSVPIEEAKALGAMALFGEKYGDQVRVIKFGNSVELCGGIHAPNTANIGLFKITSETAVAAGVRRIEAITAANAEAYFKEKAAKLDAIDALLKHPKNLEKAIEELLNKNQELSKEVESIKKEKTKKIKSELKSKINNVNGINMLTEIIEFDTGSVKDILFQLKAETDNFVGLIGNKEKDKCGLSLILSDNLVETKKWNAAQFIRDAAIHIKGGGGGQAFFATAGGKNPTGLDSAINEIRTKLN